ncbi:hypothetical protein [Thalassobaculum salexigens]|uniref:hypothetical protein n=1 Tax=Thalassobaculum salexigens TaxID=455360 RepID=UPI00048E1B3C|nr:hypothetical protein [Thalassobaculum salexigens]
MSDAQNNDTPPPTFWQRPAVRGVVNGIVFAGLLLVMQLNGVFQPPRELSEELITQDLFAGVIFGFLMYVIELWKRQRRIKAETAARETVERRLERESDDDEDDDDRPSR